MTRERYRAALRRHPDVARQVRITIATDKSGFYRAIRSTDVLVAWWFPRHELEKVAPNLKWIQVIGAGIDHLLPLDWLPRGVALVNNRGVHAPKAGEFVTMALLMLNSAMPALATQQRESRWREIHTTTIAGKTLAVMGVGHIGGTAAKRAKGLGMHVLGVRRSGRPHRYVDEMFRPAELRRVLSRADFVLVTTPVTRETRGLLGARELNWIKQGAGFINLGRAEVVDYEALRLKLERRELSGAILDVFVTEPLPPSSALWSTPNLVITPHVATDDRDHYIPRTMDLVLENVRRYRAGRRLLNRVSPVREY